jgi:hypothetical protein
LLKNKELERSNGLTEMLTHWSNIHSNGEAIAIKIEKEMIIPFPEKRY